VVAARRFLALVDPRRDRVALVRFDAVAQLEQALTADLPGVAARLAGLGTAEGTAIDAGLDAARAELALRGRPAAAPVAILLTDGRPDAGGVEAAVRSADAARRSGVTVFTIGLGDDVDGALLVTLAGTAERYYAAPGAADLADIYGRIAARLPCR
jgi:Mg-chelatase subunit ChlD